jgi:heptosyltransferase-2
LKSWERRGKRALTRALSRALRRPKSSEPLADLATLQRILLVRQHNQLGDMLLGSPLLRAVRARAPHARIDLISGPFNHEAVRLSRHVDEVLLYDKQRLMRRPLDAKRFVERLTDARYELALVVSTVAFSHTSAWLAVASRAARRAGRPGPDGRGADVASELFDWVLPDPIPGRHQTGVHLDVVTPFGAADYDWRPDITLDEAEASTGRTALLTALGPPGGSLRVVVHPGAGKESNRWPAERFGEVARSLRAVGHRVAVCAGPNERSLLPRVDAGSGTALPRLPELSIHGLGGALADADLAIVNDTGVLHLAAAVGTATLGLFGPTDPAIWCPAAPRVWTLRGSDGHVATLPADRVARAAVELAAYLQEQRPRPPAGSSPRRRGRRGRGLRREDRVPRAELARRRGYGHRRAAPALRRAHPDAEIDVLIPPRSRTSTRATPT